MSRLSSFGVNVVGENSFSPGEPPIIIGGKKARKPFTVSPGLIWGITFLILLIIVIVTLFLVSRSERDTIELVFDDDVPNLDLLQNLDPDGLCCMTGASISDQYIYLPSTNITYSQDPLDPIVACEGLPTGELASCIANATDEDGSTISVAHKGITQYYVFDIGQPAVLCDSFVPCP